MNLITQTLKGILITCFTLAATKNVISAFKYGNDSWSMTDLLINYQGGFVRRGLLGEFAYRTSSMFGIQPNIIAIAISIAGFIFVILFMTKKIKTPAYILLSPAMLGAAAYGQFIVRKDFLMISGVIGFLIIIRSSQRTRIKLFVLNVLIFVMVLIHEMFLFLMLGIIINLLWDKRLTLSTLFREFMKYPSLVATGFLVFRFSGDSSTANLINRSLINTWQSIKGQVCCSIPEATIGSIGWDPEDSIKITGTILHSFSHGIWLPAGWFASFVLAVIALILNIEKINANLFFRVVSVQFISFIPILIIGWDYGRWAFLIILTSYLVVVIGQRTAELPSADIAKKSASGRVPSKLLLLFVALPICCWSIEIYVGSTPIGYVWFNLLKPIVLL